MKQYCIQYQEDGSTYYRVFTKTSLALAIRSLKQLHKRAIIIDCFESVGKRAINDSHALLVKYN